MVKVCKKIAPERFFPMLQLAVFAQLFVLYIYKFAPNSILFYLSEHDFALCVQVL